MTPEEKRLLEETVELSRENNKILKKMRRGMFIGNIIGSLKWILLIIFTIWSWVLVQPYFESILNMYSQVQETSQTVNEFKTQTNTAWDSSGLQNLLETFRIGDSE
jgi:amino acid transporter